VSNECTGRFRCHGPVVWCDVCGDVDLVCDDPNCDAHERGSEREKHYLESLANFHRKEAELKSAEKILAEAAQNWLRWKKGNPVMVLRSQKASVTT